MATSIRLEEDYFEGEIMSSAFCRLNTCLCHQPFFFQDKRRTRDNRNINNKYERSGLAIIPLLFLVAANKWREQLPVIVYYRREKIPVKNIFFL